MRTMRLSKREITDIKLLREVLETCKVIRLGLCDSQGMFIVPVNFGFSMEEKEGEENPRLLLYFHGAKEGRKAEALKASPSLAFEMDCGHELITGDYSCAYSYAYRSIMGEGQALEILDYEEKIKAFQLIMEHTDANAAMLFQKEAVERTCVYCIQVTAYTGKMRAKKTVPGKEV